ncbi:MAG: hypothetical protein JOZ15_13645 [Acidobacteria bacterium]|nr:hypothetical protein [Acidobacteriota bacterium]
MLVLAIYNLKGNEALLARELAAVLGRTVYEMSSRVRAPGGGPSVMACFADPRAAHDAAALLAARGFDLLVLGDGEIEADERRFVVRSFELGGEAMTVESRAGKLVARYQDIDLLLRGIKIVARQAAAPRPTRRLSLTRAALSAGLVLTKTVQAPRPKAIEEREGFLHLYARGLPPLAWRESELRYSSLRGPLLPSRQANFAQVVAELRRRCPRAAYDERLASRAGQAQLLGPTLSAGDHLDVAISVLAAALRQPAPT